MEKPKRYVVLAIVIVASSLSYAVFIDAPTVYVIDCNLATEENVSTYIIIEKAENIKGVYINLSYDASVVNVEDIRSSEFSITSYKYIDNERGYVGFAAVNIEPLSGDIEFAEIHFKAVGEQGDSTPLNFNSVTINDGVSQVRSCDLDGIITIL
ncbi:MAG: cohesin domain-containing protein [Halobacteriota archaeon]|nr:cohesin domain-containing protein [Halobacteriota archaeon]